MPAATILLIDDDPKTALALSHVLAGNGRVTACRLAQSTCQQVIHRIDAVLDFDLDSAALRTIIVRFSPGADVVVLTGSELVEFEALERESVAVEARPRTVSRPRGLAVEATQRLA